MNIRDALPYLSDARAAALEREVSATIRDDVAALKAGFTATWRERSRDRLSREPAHADVNALHSSLEAIDEAIGEGCEFSWACTDRERTAAQDRCVAKAAGRLV